MDRKQRAVSTRKFEDFEPTSELVSEEDCDTLLLNLPGFKKEQLRIQLTKTRILKISGERQLRDNNWSRFLKEFPVAAYCIVHNISAEFKDGILYVRLPKEIPPAAPKEGKEKPTTELAPQPPKMAEDEPQPLETTAHQEQDTQKSTSMTDQKSTNGLENVAEKEPEKTQEGDFGDAENGTEESQDQKEDFSDNVDDAAKTANETANNVDDGAKTGTENYEQPLAGLRKLRKLMNLVLVILAALVLGIYVTNLFGSSKKLEQ